MTMLAEIEPAARPSAHPAAGPWAARRAASGGMASSDPGIPETRLTLIERCREGKDDAWRTFFEIYGNLTFRYARHAGLSDTDAEEVVAAVVRSIMQSLRSGFKVDHGIGRFRHYLKTVINHAIVAQRKRAAGPIRARDIDKLCEDPPAPVDPEIRRMEQEERLRLCLDRLRSSRGVRPRDMLAFERYVLNREPAERVARDLGLSTARLYSIRTEMIQRIRETNAKLNVELGEV